MKKLGFLSLLLILMIALAGCSSSTGAGGSKVEVEVEKASFVLLGDQGQSIDSEAEKNPIAVTLNIKNKSDSTITVSSYSEIKVYDGDKQLTIEPVYDTELGFDSSPGGDIGAGKSKEVTIIFQAEKEKEYEIGVKPFVMGETKEGKEVSVEFNTSEYTESFDHLDDPAKALAAYIETIYLDKENVDYEKLVAADKQALQDAGLNSFKEVIDDSFYDLEVSKEEAAKQYAIYKTAMAQKVEVKAATIANANGKAKVKLEYSSLPLGDLYDKISDYREEYLDNTGEYDGKKRDEYAYSKLDSIINSLEIKNAKRPLEIQMVEKDGKWTVNGDHYNSEEIVDVFAKGRSY
ncbi:DUF5105 domain-containing protein [Lysinibacillus odysseyi]|uniref:DUF5105 domain-containing protein n=1 Tax=Lysinibacillus odysseyi TaxID=202611 RepID=UPI00068F9935|nr:DUF5105 domain-containing protein [Lysinibacillus odysseyi]